MTTVIHSELRRDGILPDITGHSGIFRDIRSGRPGETKFRRGDQR